MTTFDKIVAALEAAGIECDHIEDDDAIGCVVDNRRVILSVDIID